MDDEDLFAALGACVPDAALTLPCDEFMVDAELEALLGPVFGWDPEDAPGNSLIMFPGGDAAHPGPASQLTQPPGASGPQPPQQPPQQPQQHVSPFSGVTDFSLFPGASELAAAMASQQLQQMAGAALPPTASLLGGGGAPFGVGGAAAPAAFAAAAVSGGGGGAAMLPPAFGLAPAQQPADALPLAPQQQLMQQLAALQQQHQVQAQQHEQQAQQHEQQALLLRLQQQQLLLQQSQQQQHPQHAELLQIQQQQLMLQAQLLHQQPSYLFNVVPQQGPQDVGTSNNSGSSGGTRQQRQAQDASTSGSTRASHKLLQQHSPVSASAGTTAAAARAFEAAAACSSDVQALEAAAAGSGDAQAFGAAAGSSDAQTRKAAAGSGGSGGGAAPTDEQGGSGDRQAAGGQGGCQQQQQEQQQAVPKRRGRGRPPKIPGQYSKGYHATMRYREKKKGKAENMEAEVARKLAELAALQTEQSTLRSRQQAVESTMTHQQTMLAELFSQLSATGNQEVQEPLEAEVFAVALQHTALHCQDSVCVAAAAMAAAEVAQQRRISQQQAAAARLMHDAPAFWKRYQTYVQAAAAALAAAASGEPQLKPFPTFPFTLVETLSLWRFSRLALEAQPAGAMAAPGSGGGDGSGVAADPGPAATPAAATADSAHNLSTGACDAVPPGYWAGVAQSLPFSAEQRLAAEAAWRLYAAAIGQLNTERAELQQRLAAAAAGAGDVTEVLDSIERNLTRARAVVSVFGWSMLCMLDARQVAHACVASWPYFPLVRAIVGHVLGKGDAP